MAIQVDRSLTCTERRGLAPTVTDVTSLRERPAFDHAAPQGTGANPQAICGSSSTRCRFALMERQAGSGVEIGVNGEHFVGSGP